MKNTLSPRLTTLGWALSAGMALVAASAAHAANASSSEPLEVIETPPGPTVAFASAYPVQACQGEVARSLRNVRELDANSIRFLSAESASPRHAQDASKVTGQGQYRRARGALVDFTYSCAFNGRTGALAGVMFRDPQAEAQARQEAQAKAWEPDLSRISPQDCASAVATALQVKFPRVGAIRLNAEAWRMQPGPAGRTLLQGEGGLQRAQGMSAVPFTYSCDVETRSGRVLDVRTSV